jgi:hypothetical protein
MTNASSRLHFERTVVPDFETPISLQMVPQSICHLYDPKRRSQRLQLDADDHGIVRFHLRASRDARPTELHLECESKDGQRAIHTLVISCDARKPVERMRETVAAPVGESRAPLQGDPMTLSNRELMALAYPPRPDPVKTPPRYARWLRRVSRPFTAVNPRKVPHPDITFGRSKLSQPTSGITPAPLAVQPMVHSQFSCLAG